METPADIIKERQRVLGHLRQQDNIAARLPAGPAELSQRELAALTKDYKGGPIAPSTVSRWHTGVYQSAGEDQLAMVARAWADPDTRPDALLARLRRAFGYVNENTEPRTLPDAVKHLTDAQWAWMRRGIEELARDNRRLIQEAREGTVTSDTAAEDNGDEVPRS